MKTRTVMILPTLGCNQNCSYCYVTFKDKTNIEVSTINKIYSETSSYLSSHANEKIIFLWHGGEPTLIGKNSWDLFFKNQMVLADYTVRNSVQTNLISNRNIIDWFLCNKFNVSSSLDGDFEIQSKTRNNKYSAYLNLIKNLRHVRENQKSFGVICVVSKYQTELNIERLLLFYENLSVNVKFNMVSDGDWDKNITYSEFFDFLKKIASYWLNDKDSKINVDPISSDIAALFGDKTRTSCNRNIDCFKRFIAIDNKGDCYPCTRFVGNHEWLLGNISNFSFEKYWDETTIDLLERISYRKKCKLCEYIELCGGGCKGQHNDDSEENIDDYCESFKDYINFLRSILEQKIENAKAEKAK